MDCEKFVRRYLRNDKSKIRSPKSGKMINMDGAAARRIFFECGGREEDLRIQEVEYPEDYCDTYMDVYNTTYAHKITNPKTGNLILTGGAEAARIFRECETGVIEPRKSKRVSVPASELEVLETTTCDDFVKTYDKLKKSGKVAKLRSPITKRQQRSDGAAAKKSYLYCKGGASPVKKPKKPTKKPAKKSPARPATKATKSNKSCTERSKVPLRQHQLDLIKFINKRDQRGAIAAFETGSGKTLTAIGAAVCALDANPRAKIMVVTPVSLQGNFKKEMEKFGLEKDDPRFEFETIDKFAKNYKSRCTKNTFLIVDEAHKLKGKIVFNKVKGKFTSGANAHSFVECSKKAWKVLLLTATPLYNSPYDIVNLVAMAKGIDPMTQNQFKRMVKKADTRDFDEFFSCMIYFYNDVDRTNFPEERAHDIRLTMTPDYYDEYMKVEKKELMNNPGAFNADPFIFLTGLRKATNALKNNPKVDWVLDRIVEDAEQGHKSVVYSNFIDSGIEQIARRLKSEYPHIKFRSIFGKISAKDREATVEAYNNNEIMVLLLTKAGGEGLDLKETRNVILLERSWNESTEKQVIGRGIRYMSHANLPADQRFVNVYRLMLVKPPGLGDKNASADEMIETLLENKKDDIQNLIARIRDIKDCLDD